MDGREALGRSCFLVGLMVTVLSVGIGAIKIVELGIDRFIQMGMLLSFSIPITSIGYWLLKPYINIVEW